MKYCFRRRRGSVEHAKAFMLGLLVIFLLLLVIVLEKFL